MVTSPTKNRVLVFVEDPGAANFVRDFPTSLAGQFQCELFAGPSASTYLTHLGVHHTQVSDVNFLVAELEHAPPSVVILGTSEDPDAKAHVLREACRRLGVPTIGVIDMEHNAELRFRGRSDNPLNHVTDWLAVPDDATRNRFVALGVQPETITVCGHPLYDLVRDQRANRAHIGRAELRSSLFPALDRDRPMILFVAEGVDQLNPGVSFRDKDFSLDGRGGTDFRTAIALEELLDACAEMAPSPQIVLRLHPKNTQEEFEAYLPELATVSQGGNPHDAVWAADIVVGLSSMLLVEAYLLGRPVFSILPRQSDRSWLVTTANGLTPIAKTRNEIRRILRELSNGITESSVHNPAHNSLLPSNSLTLVRRMIEQIFLSVGRRVG